jgi:signal transduction histidine kinase
MGQMASGVGHELYNPLAAIKNAAFFLGMALEDADPDVREAVEIMKSETAESERIIKTLLDFARTGSTDRKPIDANATVRKALSRIKVPETITTRQRLARALPMVKADPDQLEIVLRNLMLNAVQAMPDGGALIVGSRSSRPGSVSIYVTDTGEGIPEENRARIFDPLFTTKPKGVGLGLTVAKRLVEAHNGKISVQSGEKAGCTFTITIPIGTEEAT